MIPRDRKGLLVVIEGIDGAGKSTVLERLAGYCRGLGEFGTGMPVVHFSS